MVRQGDTVYYRDKQNGRVYPAIVVDVVDFHDAFVEEDDPRDEVLLNLVRFQTGVHLPVLALEGVQHGFGKGQWYERDEMPPKVEKQKRILSEAERQLAAAIKESKKKRRDILKEAAEPPKTEPSDTDTKGSEQVDIFD